MTDPQITLAFFDNTDPGVGGWLVLVVWFVLFVFILNTIIFFLRRLFRRWRANRAESRVRHGEKQA
jgi:threonine/homoserine/homoserine lactone efflux protein